MDSDQPVEYVPYSFTAAADGPCCSSSLSDSQTRQYQLLENLQNLVQKLPGDQQQRLPHNLLSDIASSLLDAAIFTIVADLEEIQHLTEKNLYTQRQKLVSDHAGLKQQLNRDQREDTRTCKPHNKQIMQHKHEKQKVDLNERLKKELHDLDKRLLVELDQKVMMQQTTLQAAGVPGFFVTMDSKDLKLQMVILKLIHDVASL
ncbi:protein DGCR6-like [Ciona intestinalis]